MNQNNGNSSQNKNILRADVSDILIARSVGVSKFLNAVLANGQNSLLFSPARNYKHEWINVHTKPQFFTIASADNGANTLTFKENAPAVNYILAIEGETNVLIKSLSGLTATVDILTNGATLTGINNAIASVVSEGTPEGRAFEDGKFQGGDPEYNYTQNFDEGYVITGSMQQMDAYARLNSIETQQMFAIDRYLKKLSNAVLRGSKYETTMNGKRVSAMGGLRSFVNVKGGNVMEVQGGKPTFEAFAKMVEMIASVGGDVSKLTIYANTKWAVEVNKFNAITASVNDMVRGGIPEYILIPGAGKVKIEFDTEFMPNEIYFLNMDNIGAVPLGDRNGYFTEPKDGGDAISSNLIAEYTLEVRNGKIDHGVIIIKS